jgi:2-isopropylmalate synthase
MSIELDNDKISNLLSTIKQKEYEGFSYDTALASFEVLIRREIGQIKDYYSLQKFRVTDERRWNAKGEIVTEAEATVFLKVKDSNMMTVGTGNGPVNAIDSALRKALIDYYPNLKDLKLTDYKVMILSSEKGTGAITRVLIESSDSTNTHWTTIGVSPNIIDASYSAIFDSITYKLFNDAKNKN